MLPQPRYLAPALPAELLSFLVTRCAHPTTLVVCASRADFLSSFVQDALADGRRQLDETLLAPHHRQQQPGAGKPRPAQLLLAAASLHHVAVARHLRVVFIPTVSHLRAFLSVFSVGDSKVPAPPPLAAGFVPEVGGGGGGGGDGGGEGEGGGHDDATVQEDYPPLLLVYGFLDIHRDTSEWSVQGLASTAATLVEVAGEAGFRPVVVEPERPGQEGEAATSPKSSTLLAEAVPILSGTSRRGRPEMDEARWIGRTVSVRQVLGRWFRFGVGEWEEQRNESSSCHLEL